MKQLLILTVALLCTILLSACASNGNINSTKNDSGELHHGQVTLKEGVQQAWDSTNKKFVSLEEFWRTHAKRNGGLTWGQSATYPPYNDVKEYDLFMVEVGDEICLMEFYHSRWRRANDVRRWDEAFNEYSACAKVFD